MNSVASSTVGGGGSAGAGLTSTAPMTQAHIAIAVMTSACIIAYSPRLGCEMLRMASCTDTRAVRLQIVEFFIDQGRLLSLGIELTSALPGRLGLGFLVILFVGEPE